MNVAVHPSCAWVADETTGTIYALRLPSGVPVALEGVAAIIFSDIADGLDPVTEAIARWPESPQEVASSTTAFVDSLVSAGLVRPVTDAVVRTYRVLFVCTANICRSAYAEAVATAAAIPGVTFSSAGTHGWVGQPIDPPMAAVLPAGVDATRHRGRQLTRELVEDADLVVALSARHRAFVLDEWPGLARKTVVIGHAARELATLPSGSAPEAVVEHLWVRRTQRPEDSVADPYQRGPVVAAACAARINSDLNVILERLGTLDLGGTRE